MSPNREAKRNMNAFKRMMALMLAIMMLATVVACGKTEDPAATTTAQGGDAVDTTTAATEQTYADPKDDPANYDANGYWKDDLPEDLNYNGDVVSVLNWKAEENEFEILEQTGTLVDDAIYQRNMNIEERLGVDLTFTEIEGSNSYIADFAQYVQQAYQSGSRDYDIIPTYSRTAAVLSTRGLYYNQNEIEDNYINLEQLGGPIVSPIPLPSATRSTSSPVTAPPTCCT